MDQVLALDTFTPLPCSLCRPHKIPRTPRFAACWRDRDKSVLNKMETYSISVFGLALATNSPLLFFGFVGRYRLLHSAFIMVQHLATIRFLSSLYCFFPIRQAGTRTPSHLEHATNYNTLTFHASVAPRIKDGGIVNARILSTGKTKMRLKIHRSTKP